MDADTQSVRDSQGTRVRIYCRTCARSWWHTLHFVPVSLLLRPRPRWGRRDEGPKKCVDCPSFVERGRYAPRCLVCQRAHASKMARRRWERIKDEMNARNAAARRWRRGVMV